MAIAPEHPNVADFCLFLKCFHLYEEKFLKIRLRLYSCTYVVFRW